jgi:hypothetical protein
VLRTGGHTSFVLLEVYELKLLTDHERRLKQCARLIRMGSGNAYQQMLMHYVFFDLIDLKSLPAFSL